METYYDVTFNTMDGKSIIKRNVVSEHDNERVWEDACEKFDETHLYIKMNENTLVNLLRNAIVRIDITKVEAPIEKKDKRRDEFREAVYTLSEMGL